MTRTATPMPTTELARSSRMVSLIRRRKSRMRSDSRAAVPYRSTACQDWNFATSPTALAKAWTRAREPKVSSPTPRTISVIAARLSRPFIERPPINIEALPIRRRSAPSDRQLGSWAGSFGGLEVARGAPGSIRPFPSS